MASRCQARVPAKRVDVSREHRAFRSASHASRLTPHASLVWHLADAVIWSERGPEDELPGNGASPRRPAVMDLDWPRLAPWLELTAQLFDPPACRSLLTRLTALEIVVAGPAPERPGAGWLWIGWLASRLGWQFDGEAPSRKERRLTGPAGAVTARVRVEAAPDVEAGEPLQIRFSVDGAAEPLVLQRQPTHEPGHLWIAVCGGRCIRLGERDEAVLLAEALADPARDRVYEAAWEMAVRLWQG